jgi:aryl-alcohol dehydrogenase-like predicted oxidoreductase
MRLRQLGRSGLQVAPLAFGTMTFGGEGVFSAVGRTGEQEARRLVDLCLDAGVNLFDTADVYSNGLSECLLGAALEGRRQGAVIATKAFGQMGPTLNDGGASRRHLVSACEASLRRLKTDYIDLYQMHQYDSLAPLEETVRALDDLVRSGKVRYVGCSNYSGWQLMKALALADGGGRERFVAQQIHYSLLRREAEWELLPLARSEGVGVLVWSPLSGGLLSGKFRRGAADPPGARGTLMGAFPFETDRERLFAIVDVLLQIAAERAVSAAQVAINYVLVRRGVSAVILGARDEAQLKDNLAAASWTLAREELARLDAASESALPYPYALYRGAIARNSPFSRGPAEEA